MQLAPAASQKGASITLKARWSGTSYLLESAELLAEEDASLYWRLLDAWSAPPVAGDQDPATCWKRIVHESAGLLHSGMAKMVPLVLGSRQFTAQVEMYRQLAVQLHPQHAKTSCCFVEIEGHVATSAAQLQELLISALHHDADEASVDRRDVLFPFDHVYKGEASSTEAPGATVHAILYGAAGTACFAEMHHLLKLAVGGQVGLQARRPLVYAVRPLLSEACEVSASGCAALGALQEMPLPGYGVEAALKNMEYSAMDDKKKKEQSKGAAPEVDELHELKGFMFSKLVERRPALRQELLTFRDHLASSEDDEDGFKVWDLKDVGLQASQRIMQAQDPLALLAEISQNFPSLVSSLSRQNVNSSLRSAVTHNQQYLSPGMNFMLINGLMADVNNFDYFGLLERIRIEVKLSSALRDLGLSPEVSLSLLELRADDASDSLDEVRVDLQPLDSVVFFNNLERDRQYQRFSSSIMDILQVFPGQLRPLAKNVFTCVMILDPTAVAARRIFTVVDQLLQGGYPIRFGIAMVVPASLQRVAQLSDAAPEWTDMSLQEQFARTFLTVKAAFGGKAAFRMLTTYAAYEAGTESTDPYTSLYGAFTDAWTTGASSPINAKARVAAKKDPVDVWGDIAEGAGYAAEVGSQLSDLSRFLLTKGVAGGRVDGSAPQWWLNGMLSPVTDSGDVHQELLQKIMAEQQRVQEHVYYSRIDDGDNVLTSLLKLSGALTRWNPSIMGNLDSAKTISLAPLLVHPASASLQYLYRQHTQPHSATHLVVVNPAVAEGRRLMQQALRFIAESKTSRISRVGFVFNPAAVPAVATDLTLVEVLVQAAVGGCKNTPRQVVAEFLLALLSDSALVDVLAGPVPPGGVPPAELAQAVGSATAAAGAAAECDPIADMQVLLGSSDALPEYSAKHSLLARQLLHLHHGVSAVISNGRVIIAHEPEAAARDEGTAPAVVAEDFGLLQMLVTKYQPGEAVAKLIGDAHENEDIDDVPAGLGPVSVRKLDDMTAGAASLIAAQRYPETANRIPNSVSKQVQQVLSQLRGRSVEVGAREGQPAPFHISAVFNPLTRTAQKLSQVLLLLRTTLGPSMSLYLNPQRDLSDLPLKSYYRFALPDFTVAEDGSMSIPSPPAAYFTRLPKKRVLTLNMDVPEPWLVEPVRAPYDLDNLRLVDVTERTAYAEFELASLMLTGACYDVTGGGKAPARGAQLYLGSADTPHVTDTLVMSNLAYFQLKAAPGLWNLSLAQGRTQDVYMLESSTGLSAAAETLSGNKAGTVDEQSSQVVISSLTGKHMRLVLRKRPGLEAEDVLKDVKDQEAKGGSDGDMHHSGYPYGEEDDDDDDDEDEHDEDGGLWGGLTSMLGVGGGKEKKPKSIKDKPAAQAKPAVFLPAPEAGKELVAAPKLGGDVINMFTVASGHMYERLQKIMMLSVINNTQSRVKFWIISNYISPHHKAVIPRIAAKYGFDYQFVTYKWPHWLNKQTEKQRIIWATKILFLDVLFPLDVQRVIFVDSDQIIRTDMGDLYHMDIKGAVYAYTPFCDNNKEMDEFRFWKGGFWASHLRGLPYHISALYLVDLVRFRQTAAGDQLRVIYEQLSKDPNSLANLDQDLPNYAQQQIPIFSLPVEWLWCESWCGNETKAKARTIDLCNNPKTKEPKLSAARRIVPEWTAYDEDQARITAIVEAELAAEAAGGTLPAPESGAVSTESSGVDAGRSSPEAAENEQRQSAAPSEPDHSDHTEL